MTSKIFQSALIATAAIFLQINARAADAKSAAAAWQALTNMNLSPPPMAWSTNTPTQADIDKFDDNRAKEAAAIADKAHEFYSRYPKDTNVLHAQLIEIDALQKAVHLGMTNQSALLLNREDVVARNTNAPAALRYELRVDLLGREIDSRIKAGADPAAEREKAGRTLLKEFPDGSLGYEILLTVAMTSDLAKLKELAQLMADSSGPPALTAIGKGLLNQLKAVGERLPIEFTMADGKPVNALTLSNKVVLVDFWATWCPICVDAMPELKKLYDEYHPSGLEIVGVNFDEETNRAQKFLTDRSLFWPQYFGGYGEANQYGRKYGSALPYVWLVDKKG
ncbi:MAG TPA: TlpA disulfide reductase family protein, partial [Desulfuromonadaceae bacterium]|nr:TlpA disulfide reductase family protein [Desulfuromonadaceae bacterium]